jgi:CarD family transcriptional regulator
MKASVRVRAPARTAKAASVAVARIHGEAAAPSAAKAAPKPAAPKLPAKAVAKPVANEAAMAAANEAPKPAASHPPKPAAKEASPQASKETPKPAAKTMPKAAAAQVATTGVKPTPHATPHAKPEEKPPTAKAAAAPPMMKIAAAVPQAAAATPAAATPATEQPVAAARPVAPPPRAAPPPGHIDRRPGPTDRIPPRPPSKAEIFIEGDYVVYPTHGVGKVERIATEEIAGHKLELIHITFEENRMTLRVPVAKARSAGLRKLATRKLFDEAMVVLKGRARIKRTMWSRRAQEYEAKINSGDPLAIAEVVRDLHRNAGQPDQSFSERQIYEAAMDRLAAELAALDKTDKPTAVTKLGDFLKTV